MKNFKIKSYCKINLSLKVLKKLRNGYHNIISLVTFCELHDVISITKINSSKDKINFSGKFKNGINNKILNEDAIIESLVSFKRAGASAVVTYFAEEVAKKLR